MSSVALELYFDLLDDYAKLKREHGQLQEDYELVSDTIDRQNEEIVDLCNQVDRLIGRLAQFKKLAQIDVDAELPDNPTVYFPVVVELDGCAV
jgi:hypothetical protein